MHSGVGHLVSVYMSMDKSSLREYDLESDHDSEEEAEREREREREKIQNKHQFLI